MPFDGILAGTRFGLYADLTLLMGLPFFWWAMGRGQPRAARATLTALALGGMLLSALWLLVNTAAMAGTPILPPDWAMIEMLLIMSPLGGVLAMRMIALSLLLLLLPFRKEPMLVLLPAAIAAGTLAWTGHAGATEGVGGSVHRVADTLHIWAAAGWIGALAALLHALFSNASTARVTESATMLARFSMLGSIFVGTLVVTGAVNSVMIVGLSSLPALIDSRYGLLLALKIALFGVMLGLAACNRWWLTPALERARQSGSTGLAIRKLRISLLMETGAALAILALVAILGTLDPLA